MSTSTIPIILASSSPRRRELLHALGLPFQVLTSDVDETTDPNRTPDEIVTELALRKAREIARKTDEGIVIGADTIVVLEQTVLGKPRDEADAFRMLSNLQGREHTVFSGVAVIDAASGREEVTFRSTRVRMRSMSEAEIRAYIATGEPMDKAGSYAIQGFGATLVEGIVGDYFTVVGLPLHATAELLARFGIRIF